MSVMDLTHDRVWEAYYGDLGPNFMRSTQKRIHWICSMVEGKRVLDVGCSSGIVPILLGREGREVLGIDNSNKVIEQAKEHLSNEAGPTQARVSFVEADFLTVDPTEHHPFDTIIISEVLEHLVRPQDMLDAAAKFLKTGGQIIVTVPFGINDFIDHKRTFYLTGIHDLVSRNFGVISVEFLGTWIGLVAMKSEGGSPLSAGRDTISSEEVKQLERSFYLLERSIRDELSAKKEEVSRLEVRARKAIETAKAVSVENQKLEDSARKNERRERELLSEREKLGNELAHVRAEKIKLEESAKEREQRENELSSERDELSSKLAQALSTAADATSDRDKVGQLEAALRHSRQMLVRSDRQRLAAESRASSTQNSLTFQLGAALIRATNSWSGLLQFPKEALRIHKESKRRQRAKLTKTEAGVKKKEQLLNVARSAPLCKLEPENSRRLRIAAIMDEFTAHSYEPECTLLQLEPQNWQEQLTEFTPDLLFIESAWKGLGGLWHGRISNSDPVLLEIIDWCRRRKIPSLLWNKEDPVHFSTFLPVAECVDYVFTTDMDCIPKYKEALRHDRVYLLPFAAQPKAHNPIELYKRKDAFNFAGSYYLRYPERQRDFEALIDAVGSLRPVEIHDRNFDNPHPHYNFPEKYKSMILGSLPFAEIDKAYKGYRYGINMNTIKQSQTMFARRVFELLASNTVVVSNFSRGVRLLFGDLVISSDDAAELHRRLKSICANDIDYRKFRLLGLRKVMEEHTYADRLRLIRSKLSGNLQPPEQPLILLFSAAETRVQYAAAVENFKRQTYSNKRLLILKRYSEREPTHGDGIVECTNEDALVRYILGTRSIDLAALFHPHDYYGPAYLTDLQLARKYSSAQAFGKVCRYKGINGEAVLHEDGHQYRQTERLLARSAVVQATAITGEWLVSAVSNPSNVEVKLNDMLALDEFNYIEDGMFIPEVRRSDVNDLFIADNGASLSEHIFRVAENSSAESDSAPRDSRELPQLDANQLHGMITSTSRVDLRLVSGKLHLSSRLAADKHVYLYCRRDFNREELNLVLNSQFELVGRSELDLKTVFEFKDENGAKISHQINKAGGRHSLAIPENCATVRFGLRLQGPGKAIIETVLFGSQLERPAVLALRSPYLVLSKQYPAYDDLYRYGFLHSRLRAYKKEGLVPEVFRMSKDADAYREFEGIDVATGDASLLRSTLETGQVKHVLVHLLDEHMWDILKDFINRIKISIWIHGAEIQVWQRRTFEFERMDDQEVARQKRLSDKRRALWRRVFSESNDNLAFVFVSEYFLNEVQSDIGIELDKSRCHVIHNFIDGDVFRYSDKNENERKRILSVRPYANRKYANDLTVSSILELSKRDIFNDLSFTLFGDGDLFEQTTAPLRSFSNVTIERRFLSQAEIAEVHKGFGVFLTPTRMDAQGVSRDEAMSSGLVPITTNVACIPEFVDQSCGIVVPAEDYIAMADAIEGLYVNPSEFTKLSKAASLRVRRQSGYEQTIEREIALIQRP
ncbi:methyltransferase domain-containing protein [Sinorhizobium meliloti]|nr:methyltransferase domain-containing protein [Sinorhizobium meliloti]